MGELKKQFRKYRWKGTPSFPLVQLYYTTLYIKVNNFIIQNSKKSKNSQTL